MNTASFLSIPAALFPEQEILVFEKSGFTYGETLGRVRRLASSLQSLGIRRGDRVAVLQTNSHQYVEAYYATATIGGVFVPLNYRAKVPELEYMLTAAAVSVLMVGDRYVALVNSLRPKLSPTPVLIVMDGRPAGVMHFEDLIASGSSDISEAEVDENDTTILMYTSGTTAFPKGVMLTHGDFTAYVCGNVELADGTPRGTALLCVPLYHIAGATNIMTTVFAGRRLIILRQFDARAWLETMEKERATHAFVVPTMLKQILDEPDFSRYDLSSLENLSYGGAPMPFPLIRRAIEMFPRRVGFVNAFGQTETTSTLTILGPEDHRIEGTAEEKERKLQRLTSIGKPLPDVELKIVDETGGELSAGEMGEIVVRTPRLMKGYATQAETGAETVEKGWLHTRDMGWVDSEGYVYLVGRKDDMIIRGGENIAPAEVEGVLHSHPAVEEAAVFGLPDEEWGQRVAAAVVLRPGHPVTAEEISDFCRQRLASFKKPEMIRFFSALPHNPLGKILKKELRTRWERGEGEENESEEFDGR